MSDIRCMHFVDHNCYEEGNAEEFMGFSLPKRLSENTQPWRSSVSVVKFKGHDAHITYTVYFLDLNGFNFVSCRKCQHTLFMVFYSGLFKSRIEDNSSQFEINTW